MNEGLQQSYSPHVLRWWKLGTAGLWAALAAGLLFIAYLVWNVQEYVGFFLVVPLVVGAAVWLVRHPYPFLLMALAGFVLIATNSDGLQVTEIGYGLFFMGYLAYWYIRHFYLEERRLLYSVTDWAVMLFLIYIFASISWALFFGARLSVIFGEALILIMLAFYFPIKEACAENKKHVRDMLLVLCWIGCFTAVRNLIEYREGLASADKLYQILTGRVSMNEVLLMMPALGALSYLIYAGTWRMRIVLAGLFILFFGSLIVTQSRGYWVAFLLGALALFLLTDARRKGRIVVLFGSGLIGFLIIGFVLFPDYILLVSAGVIDRFASLGTALTSDISLVNRFYESKAAWSYIKTNPILGFGMGTPYEYFNIISDHNRNWSFIHNGYIGVWYKYGLVGLGLFMTFWLRSIYTGIKLFKRESAPRELRLAALAATICLIAELLVANTSTPFQIADGTLMLTMMGGIINGSYSYTERTELSS